MTSFYYGYNSDKNILNKKCYHFSKMEMLGAVLEK